jgi:hypothetical protein
MSSMRLPVVIGFNMSDSSLQDTRSRMVDTAWRFGNALNRVEGREVKNQS